KAMLGTRLVTHQSGPEGLPVDRVYIESGSDIARELYLSLLVDRAVGRGAIMASAAGGRDSEEVAAKTPEQNFTVHIHPAAGLQQYLTRRSGFGLGLGASQQQALEQILRKLVQLFPGGDASLVAINPLIVTGDGKIVALDAKINVEDNALFRQQRLAGM